MAQTDRDVLLALYRSTDGPNWRQKNDWDTDADLLGWSGVQVDGEGRLVRLSLSDNKLRGFIPAELGQLAALVSLDLGANNLSGTIPKELGSLCQLEELKLGWNQLTGPIPPELGNLAVLHELYLSGNQLSGHIPPRLGDLGALKYLCLSSNKLDGSIPPELGNLAALKRLHLAANQLSGNIPPQLGQFGALEFLNLDNNELDGPFPPSNFMENPEEVLRWVQIRQGQSEDVVHSHASRAVDVLTSLWHFFLPVLDDITDLWLLWETFGGSHGGLWWTCFGVFFIADIERAYTALFLLALLLSFALSMMLDVVACGCVGVTDVGMSFLAGQRVDVSKPWHLLLDSLLWTLFGSRARSSPLMRIFGLAGDTSGQALQETGLGLHAIDVIVFYHPFRYFGELVMSFPRGRRRREAAMRNVPHRRKISMVRAVGETLWVDPLFLALSVVTGGWDDNFSGLVVLSALFSALELVTELQYYVTEAEDANPLAYAVVGDVEVGVAGASGNPDPRPTEGIGPSHG